MIMNNSLTHNKEQIISGKLNIEIFRFFNETFGKPIFDNIIILTQKLGEPSSFPYYFLLFITIASLMLYQKKHDKATIRELAISWLSAAITLFISLVANSVIVLLIKNYASVHRPFCSLADVYIVQHIVDKLSCNMSFPSGHTAFVTIMAASFWPLMNHQFKIISASLVAIVAISRMATGAHYPMDLFGAIVLCLPLTLYLRFRVSSFINQYKTKRPDILDQFIKLLTSKLSKYML